MPHSEWTPQILLARTFSSLRSHPELVLPVLAADGLEFVVMHLQHALHEPLLRYFLVRHQSVLGSTPEHFVLTPDNAVAAAVVTGPLLLICYFLSACLYAAALLSTATMMRQIRVGKLIPVREAIAFALQDRGRVLHFAVSLWGLAILWAVAGYIAFPIVTQLPVVAKHIGFDFGLFLGLVLEIPCAYVIAGPVLKFLHQPGTKPEDMRKIPVFLGGLLFIVTQTAFLICLHHVVPRSLFQQTTVPGFLTQQAITSIVGALLYVPLFVAWSLVATPEEEGSEVLEAVTE